MTGVGGDEGPVHDRLDPAVALRLLNADVKPMACCPKDGEPLILTFEKDGAEFHCVVCGGWFGFLSPRPEDPTPDLEARHLMLKARFDAGEMGPS